MLLSSNSSLPLFRFASEVSSEAASNNSININASPQTNEDVFVLSSSALLDLGSAR